MKLFAVRGRYNNQHEHWDFKDNEWIQYFDEDCLTTDFRLAQRMADAEDDSFSVEVYSLKVSILPSLVWRFND